MNERTKKKTERERERKRKAIFIVLFRRFARFGAATPLVRLLVRLQNTNLKCFAVRIRARSLNKPQMCHSGLLGFR